MDLCWHGTNSFLLRSGNTLLAIDPFLKLPLRGTEDAAAREQAKQTMLAAEAILITHGHIDHLLHVKEIAGEGNIPVYCSATPASSLAAQGLDKALIQVIAPGQALSFGPFQIRVLKGAHIIFDKKYVLKKLFSRHLLRNFAVARGFLKLHRYYPENGETIVYHIQVEDQTMILLGSCRLDSAEVYPLHSDYLILPLQGRSDIIRCGLEIIQRLQPASIFLSHFDDSFPPISETVDYEPLLWELQKLPNYPSVLIPEEAVWYGLL